MSNPGYNYNWQGVVEEENRIKAEREAAWLNEPTPPDDEPQDTDHAINMLQTGIVKLDRTIAANEQYAQQLRDDALEIDKARATLRLQKANLLKSIELIRAGRTGLR